MAAATHSLDFEGGLLERGFWLYVWEITDPTEQVVYYVGRTGDSSSENAQSPFNRMGQHLGFAKASNTLRKKLDGCNLKPEDCSFRLIAHGPVMDEIPEADKGTSRGRTEHQRRRDIVAGLEKKLADSMTEAHYCVMNQVDSHKPLDEKLWLQVKEAFAIDFPKLGPLA